MIDRAVAAGEELIAREINFGQPGNFDGWIKAQERWNALTREMLLAVYEGEEPADEFYSAAGGGSFWVPYADDPVVQATQRVRQLSGGVNTLVSLRERLEYAEPPAPPQPLVAEARSVGRGVFLVHGRNEEKKQTVARYLDKITESGAVVLEEQADAGRTIIEKFEQHAGEAGYAVVLLTGDDEGRAKGTEELRPRARQNVILELGFFVGALGRGRVALLYEEEVELPSDISGVLYLPLDDAGAWKRKLAREMQAAEVGIDAQKVLGA
jgi:predicted nucleotide-binding protein